MGVEEDFSDKLDELKGRAKETAGAATDNDDLKAEGKADQTKANVKQKVQDVTDKIKDKLD